jgi:hypothetical protein
MRQLAEPRVDAVTCRDDGRRMLEHAASQGDSCARPLYNNQTIMADFRSLYNEIPPVTKFLLVSTAVVTL